MAAYCGGGRRRQRVAEVGVERGGVSGGRRGWQRRRADAAELGEGGGGVVGARGRHGRRGRGETEPGAL